MKRLIAVLIVLAFMFPVIASADFGHWGDKPNSKPGSGWSQHGQTGPDNDGN